MTYLNQFLMKPQHILTFARIITKYIPIHKIFKQLYVFDLMQQIRNTKDVASQIKKRIECS